MQLYAKAKIINLRYVVVKQKGMVLIIMALVLVLGAIAFLVSQLDGSGVKIERDKKTAAALSEAKSALLGFALGVNLSLAGRRPGDLPCPDNYPLGNVNEGTSGSLAGTTCNSNALGRLPWKTLGIADLRDGSGERLWYAVSTNYKNNTRTNCTTTSTVGCLNSDTNGTINLRNASGTIVNDATNSSAAIAVVIAPGSPLQRQDNLVQNRSPINYNVASHYLDNNAIEDNSDFVNSGLNGFVNGEIKNAAQQVIVNDKMIAISKQDLMPILEKRVANEVLRCMNAYAAAPVIGAIGTYPWPAKLNSALPPSYVETPNNFFGRVPSSPMGGSWSGSCSIAASGVIGWWLNWREVVFYSIADGYKPTASSPACGSCLAVSPPSVAADKMVVIIVAGQKILLQVRISNSDKGNLSNYLEPPNSAGGIYFTQSSSTQMFNDILSYR